MSSQTPRSPKVPETIVPYEDLENTRPRPWCLEQDVFDAIMAQFKELPWYLWNAMLYRVEKATREKLELERRQPTPPVPDYSEKIASLAAQGVPVLDDVEPAQLKKIFAACIERERQRR